MMGANAFDESHFWRNLDKYLTDIHNDDQRADVSDFHLVDMQDDKIATVPDVQSPETCDFQLANLSDEMFDMSDVQPPNASQTANAQTAILYNGAATNVLNLPINDVHNSEAASTNDILIENTQNDDSSYISIISNVNAKSDYSLHELYNMNRKAQKCLQDCITHLKNRLNKNLEQQNLYSKRTEKQKMLQHRPYFLFVPYFRDVRGLHPPANEDTKEKKLHNYVDAYGVTPDLWAQIEVTAFKKIVQENAYTMAAQPLLLKIEFLREKKKRSYMRPGEAKRITAEITGLRKKIDELRLKTFEDLWSSENITLDWLLISTEMRNKDYDRSPEACKLMWMNCLRPEVNKKEFTPEEDRILKRLALQNRQKNWDHIAELLGTGRTAIQCCERFQGTLNNELFKNFWTPEEEQKLVETIDFCKVGNFIPWKKLIQFMSGRTSAQLRRRWYYCDRPQNRHGAWTTEEDAILLLAHQFFDNRWRKVADFLGGRSAYRCGERYRNMLEPRLTVIQWTWEEDKLLLTLVALHGEKWELISRCFVGPTSDMIAERCVILKQDKPFVYEKVLKSGGRNLDVILPKEQFARCKIRENINNRRKQLRSEAFECAKKAMQQEVGNASTCNTFRELATKINLPTLKNIASELIPINPKEVIKCRTPYFRHDVRTMANKMKEANDENSAVDSEEEEEKEEMAADDVEAVAVEFDHRIFPTSVIASKCDHNQTLKRLNRVNEYAALRAHLLNAFTLGRKCSYDRKFVGDACFDFPAVENPLSMALPLEGQLPIISVNMTSINSLISILLIRKLMGSWMEQISPNASDMLNRIIRDEEGASKICSSCKILRQTKVNGTKVNGTKMNGSVTLNNSNKVCDKCRNTEHIANRLQLLLTRFLFTFALTSLLARIKPSKHQILELDRKDQQFFYERIQRHLPMKRVLRKRKILEVKDVYTDTESDENSTDEDWVLSSSDGSCDNSDE